LAHTRKYLSARKAFFTELGIGYRDVLSRIDSELWPEWADRAFAVQRADMAQEIADRLGKTEPIVELIHEIVKLEDVMGIKYSVLTLPDWRDIEAALSAVISNAKEAALLDRQIAGLLAQERKPDGDYRNRHDQNHAKLETDIRVILVKKLVSEQKASRRLYFGAGTLHYMGVELSGQTSGEPFRDQREKDASCQAYRKRYEAAERYLKRHIPLADNPNHKTQ
jgi:hypothetical protein